MTDKELEREYYEWVERTHQHEAQFVDIPYGLIVWKAARRRERVRSMALGVTVATLMFLIYVIITSVDLSAVASTLD